MDKLKAARRHAQRHAHKVRHMHHYADLTYLAATFFEAHTLHIAAVGCLIVIVVVGLALGDEAI